MTDEIDGLDWLRKSGHKRSTTRFKSNKDEKRGAKKLSMKQTKGSGSCETRKGDLWTTEFCGELKCTDNQSYVLQLRDLVKLLRYSAQTSTIPIFRVTFNRPRILSFVIMAEQDYVGLQEAANQKGENNG